MVTSAKSSVPTVTDQAAAMQLGQCAKNLATCLAELRTSAQKVDHRDAHMWRCVQKITKFWLCRQHAAHLHHSRKLLYLTGLNNNELIVWTKISTSTTCEFKRESRITFVTVWTWPCCFIFQAHEACGPMEIDSALTAVQTLRSELQDAKLAAANAQLKPLPGESVRYILEPQRSRFIQTSRWIVRLFPQSLPVSCWSTV